MPGAYEPFVRAGTITIASPVTTTVSATLHSQVNVTRFRGSSSAVISTRVSTWSAMQDERRIMAPGEFRAGRSKYVYMVYGYDFHFCVGAGISDRLLKANFTGLFTTRIAPPTAFPPVPPAPPKPPGDPLVPDGA